MAGKSKRVRLTTPPTSVGVYPRLNRPDTKYNEHGTYQADVRIPIEEAKPLIEKINEIYKEAVGSAHPKKAPRKDRDAVYYYETDDDGDFIVDHVLLKLRAKNLINRDGDLWDRQPKVFDAKGVRIPSKDIPRVGGGTKMRVSFDIDTYTTKDGNGGVRLVPVAVQIIDLVEYDDGGSAEDYGFGEESGFEAYETEENFEDESGGVEENNSAEADSEAEFY